MPLSAARSGKVALRAAGLVALVVFAMALSDALRVGGALPWTRVVALASVVGAIAFSIRRHRDAVRVLEFQHERDVQAREAAAKFAGIMAIAADAIVVIDSSHRIMHFNHGAESIFGYSAAEAEGQPLSRLLPDRFREVHGHHVAEFDQSPDTARRMGHRRAVSGLRKDGTEFPAEAAISKLDLPGLRRIYTVVLRDITDRKRIEDADRFLSNTSTGLTRTLDPVAVAEAIRSAAVPTLADACLVDLLADSGAVVRTAHAADARTLSTLRTLAEEHPVNRNGDSPFAKALRGEHPDIVTGIDEAWLDSYGGTQDARDLWSALDLTAMLTVPLVVGDRVVGGLTLLDRGKRADRFDSDMRRVIEEFARSAAMALDNARLYTTARRATNARDEVLSVVSHDLRNPIGAIAMCARMLRDSPPASEDERKRMLQAITDATAWMQRLIRDLLDVTSIDAGHLSLDRQPSSLSSLVMTAAGMLSSAVEERAIDLQIAVADSLPTLMVDDRRIVQVIANLLGNAIKFSEQGSRVTISAALTADGVVTTVKDAGIGIEPDVQARIFNRFWQVKPTPGRGNGLGLAIAHAIVHAHGGRIWVESDPGRGSTFAFSLPYAEANN